MPTLAARSPVPSGYQIGDFFKIRGEYYALTSVSSRTYEARLRPKTGGADIAIDVDRLISWHESAEISHEKSVSQETRNAVRLASLNSDEKWHWERRCAYVKPLLEYTAGTTRQLVRKIINSVFETRSRRAALVENNATDIKPGISTVYEWVSIVKENNGDLAALAFKEHRRNARKSRLDKLVDEIVEDAIDMHLIQENLNISIIYKYIRQTIKNHNSELKRGEERLRTPSETTIRKRLKNRNPLDVDLGKKGANYVFKHYNYGGKTEFAKFIGSRVEGDTNVVDCLIYDPILDVTYRPLLLIFMDCYTRAIVGYELSYLQRGSEKLARAMTDVMSGSNSSTYSCVPVLVVVDNGKEFDNKTLLHIQQRTNIAFCFSPPYTPNCKSMIERFFGTLNQTVLHSAKGTTKSNIFERGEYKSEIFATLTIDDLKEKIDQALDIYHRDEHGTLGLSPKTAWDDAVKKSPPRVYERDTAILYGARYMTLTVNHGRVGTDSLFWKSSALPENFNGQKVTVCINDSDLTNVWVINPDDSDDIYKLDPVDEELQTGLSLQFWKRYREELRAYNESTGNPEEADRLRHKLTTEVFESAKSGNGQTMRTRARLVNEAAGQIKQHSETIEKNLPRVDKPLPIYSNGHSGAFTFDIED